MNLNRAWALNGIKKLLFIFLGELIVIWSYKKVFTLIFNMKSNFSLLVLLSFLFFFFFCYPKPLLGVLVP